ncbi:MAG TPA: allantoin permease, partial [Gemmatimonadales bacterium]|nr:allantoin permease [Gemmatimonadales bacterium]
LYDQHGRYAYAGGVNRRAVLALTTGALTALAGLAHPALRFLFDGAWFSAAGVAGGLYWLLMRSERMPA